MGCKFHTINTFEYIKNLNGLTCIDTAYRAYTTGASSINPETVALAKHGATLYTIQLVLNLLWTPLYFGLGRPVAATVDILALGGTIACLANIWGQVDPVCGWLLAPYLGWVTFATYLCVSSQSYIIETYINVM